MEETFKLIYAKPPFKLCCSKMERFWILQRYSHEKPEGQTISAEHRNRTKHTVKAEFLLPVLPSNFESLMQRNRRVLVWRLHNFVLSSDT